MAKKIIYSIIVAIIVALMLAAIGLIVFFSTNGFGGRYTTFITNVNGENLMQNSSITLYSSGTEFKVYSFDSYSVNIYAADTDGCYYTDAEGTEYDFADLNGEDMTAGFNIEYDAKTFTVGYDNYLSGVLSAALAEEVTIIEGSSAANFKMQITSGDSVLSLTFSVAAAAPTITISTEHIYF